MPNTLYDLAQMTHPSTSDAPTNMLAKMARDIELRKQIATAQAVASGKMPSDIAYGEQGLQAPTVGPISLDPTDYLGPGMFKAFAGGALKSLPAMAGIFAGRGAKTADLMKLSQAQDMAKAGIPHEQIWRETGWALDTPDKIPRFEIPDIGASSKYTHLEEYGPSRLSQKVIEHPELYTAYPELEKITQLGLQESIPSGSMSNITEGGGFLTAKAPTEQELKPVGLHELQHAIQQREGFARGGSPEMFRGESALGIPEFDRRMQDFLLIDEAVKQGHNPVDVAKLTNPELVPFIKNIQNNKDWDYIVRQAREHFMTPENKYKSLAGEAESRLTESRMNMTPAERLSQYPYDTTYFEQATGVPLNSLIVMKNGGQAMSMPSNDMASLIRQAQAQIEAENALRNAPRFSPVNNTARNALVGLGAGGAGLAGGYYGTGYALGNGQ